MRKKEKWTTKENDKHEDAESLLHNKSYLIFIGHFKILGVVALQKSLTKYFIGEKEKWTNNGNDKYENADSVIQVVVPNVCTKFRNPRFLRNKFPYALHWSERLEKRKKVKRSQKKFQNCFFFFYTTYFNPL